MKTWLFLIIRKFKKDKRSKAMPMKNQVDARGKKEITKRIPAVSNKIDMHEILQRAKAYEDAKEYQRAITLADECIKIDNSVVEAFMIRGRCNRLKYKHDCDAAIADFSKVIELDPENATAWRYRGTSKTLKASEAGEKEKIDLWTSAIEDFKRAGELRPDEEYIGLDILELEICLGKYREAVGSLGIWWNRIKNQKNKLVCAWLGSLAQILAERPERKWAHMKDILSSDQPRFTHGDWTITEIDLHLKYLEKNNLHSEKLDSLKTVHELFMSHFQDKT